MFNFATGDTVDISGIEIFATGTHHGKEFDRSDLDQIVETYRSIKNEIEAPIKLGHSNQLAINDGLPALGWVDNVRRNGNKIVADFKNVPEKVADLIKSRAFKKVSIELLPKFKSSSGEVFERVLSGVALLGADIPEVKKLSDIPALFNETEDEVETYSMEIETYAEHSVHEPSYDGTSEKDGQWDGLDLEDFPEDMDLSEIDDHFIVSKTGFPPENFTDLSLEVVDENGNLDPDGLESAHRVVGQVEGLSEEDTNRARNIIERLAREEFGADTIDFLESDDMSKNDDDSTKIIIQEGSDEKELTVSEFKEQLDLDSDEPERSEGGNTLEIDEEEYESLKQEREEYKSRVDELEDEKEELEERNDELESKVLEFHVDKATQELELSDDDAEKFKSFVTAQVDSYSQDEAEEVIEDAKELIGSVSQQPDTNEYTQNGDGPSSNENDANDEVEAILNA